MRGFSDQLPVIPLIAVPMPACSIARAAIETASWRSPIIASASFPDQWQAFAAAQETRVRDRRRDARHSTIVIDYALT
jgi:hypothetical protein